MNMIDELKVWSENISNLPQPQRIFYAAILTMLSLGVMGAGATFFIAVLGLFPTWVGIFAPLVVIFSLLFAVFYSEDKRPVCHHCGQRYIPKEDK